MFLSIHQKEQFMQLQGLSPHVELFVELSKAVKIKSNNIKKLVLVFKSVSLAEASIDNSKTNNMLFVLFIKLSSRI